LGQQNGGSETATFPSFVFSLPGDQDARPSHVDFWREKLRLGGLGIFVNLRLNPGKSIGDWSFARSRSTSFSTAGR